MWDDIGDVFQELEETFGGELENDVLEGDDEDAARTAAEELLGESIGTMFNPGSWRSGK